MNFPSLVLPNVLTTMGPYSIGRVMNHNRGTAGSGAWPAANRALYIPMWIPVPCVATALLWPTGGTSSNNIDMGLYDYEGVKLVSIGSTAMNGTINDVQILDITDTPLSAGWVYVAGAADNTAVTILRHTLPVTTLIRAYGMVQQATAFALPATMTAAAVASQFIPVFGVRIGRAL